MDDEIESEKTKRNLKIETKEGLKISYEKEVIKKNFPHLIEEISGNKKSLKIDSITTYKNENNKEKVQFPRFSPNTLFNPEPIDFIRRCKTVEDAMSILTFLIQYPFLFGFLVSYNPLKIFLFFLIKKLIYS